MKITIIFGCLLAVFLMLMVPNISAVQYHNVKNAVNEKIEEYISETVSFDELNNERNDHSSIRMVGLGFILSFLLVRKSLDSVLQLILLRIFTICWYSIISPLNGILAGDNIFRIFIRFIAGFVFGIICPLFWLSIGFNLLFFEKIIGPIASICRIIYLLALGG